MRKDPQKAICHKCLVKVVVKVVLSSEHTVTVRQSAACPTKSVATDRVSWRKYERHYTAINFIVSLWDDKGMLDIYCCY